MLLNEETAYTILTKDREIEEDKPTEDRWWRRALNFLVWLLKSISIGKHTTKFYRKGKNKYGSVVGGTVTLIAGSFFLFSSVMTLYRCFSQQDVTISVE